jgi:serine/threonine protein kinase
MTTTDPIIGKKLGDYTIVELLGRGGMARVYRGYDEALERYAAVKVIATDFVASVDEKEYFERFQREARSIAKLRHPHIVGLYQFGQKDNLYYMAMAFLDGRDLRMILKEHADRKSRLAPREVVTMVRQIGSALDYAHQQGVIHRDVKPSNIMMTSNGAVLTDFGLALSTTEGTRGDTFGSAHYIAPEQAVSSARAVPQSDLYSLGVILYEALTGQVPFDDPSAMSVALKHLNDVPPPPSIFNPDLPPAAENVLMKILHKDYKQRYQSGAEFVEALEKALLEEDTVELSKEKEKGNKTRDPKDKTATDSDDLPALSKLPREANTQDRASSLDSYLRSIQSRGTKPLTPPPPTPAEVHPTKPISVIIEPPLPPKALAKETTHDVSRRKLALPLIFLFVILLIGGIGGIILMNSNNDDSEGENGGNEGIVAENTETITPEATDVPTLDPTEEVVLTVMATDIPTEEVTEFLSQTPTATSTATDTEAPTETNTPTATRTRRPTDTPTPIATDTMTLSPTPAAMPEIRLIYRDGAFILFNISSRNQNIGTLVFEGDQTGRFEAIDWQEDANFRAQNGNVYQFVSGGCVFIVTRVSEYSVPSGCRFVNTYLIRSSSSYQFWRTALENTTFAVKKTDGTEIVQCIISSTEQETTDTCEFALP